MRHATCDIRHTVYGIRYTVYGIRYTACRICHAVFVMRRRNFISYDDGCYRLKGGRKDPSISIKYLHVIIEERRGEGEAVNPIENATLAGQECTAVLDSQIAFHCRERDITEKTA